MAILVAYDGSRPAQKALEHAVERYDDEEIVLLRVVEAAEGYTGASINYAREAVKERREETAAAVDEEITDLLDGADVDLQMETTVGNPAKEIVAFADERDVAEIVVGNHGREGVSRVLLGSVAETVVRRAPVPVTVVR